MRFKNNKGVKYLLVINKLKLKKKKKSLIQFYSPNNKILIGVDACAVVVVQFGQRGVVPKGRKDLGFLSFCLNINPTAL